MAYGVADFNATSPAQEIYTEQMALMVGDCVSRLNPREQRIIKARWLADEPVVRQQLAEEFKVSNQRIEQLEKQALDRLKILLK